MTQMQEKIREHTFICSRMVLRQFQHQMPRKSSFRTVLGCLNDVQSMKRADGALQCDISFFSDLAWRISHAKGYFSTDAGVWVYSLFY